MPTQHIVVLGNDNATGRVMRPVAQALLRAGASVSVFLGNRARDTWATMPPSAEDVPPQEIDFSDPNATDTILTNNPDVIVSGLSAPTVEVPILDAARARGINITTFPDTWGADIRWNGEPNLVLTIDSIAHEKVRRGYAIIVGNPLYDTINAVSKDAIDFAEHQRHIGRKLILVAGQGKQWTLAHIAATKQLIETNPSEIFKVIARPHPKFLTAPNGKAEWESALETLPHGSLLEAPRELTTDHLASVCDVVITTFGTALVCAAHHNMVPISVITPEAKAEMLAQTGFERSPLVSRNCALEWNLDQPPPSVTGSIRSLEKWRVSPFDANKAAKAIIALR
jgi:hypothetical protein